MDLAKIISDLKMELQRLDAAILSMEDLARVQVSPNQGVGKPSNSERHDAPDEGEPVKRRRGRPRKKHGPSGTAPQTSLAAGANGSGGGDFSSSAV